jgi:hypothetical protein
MKSFLPRAILIRAMAPFFAFLPFVPSPARAADEPAPATDAETAAHAAVLDLSGAFTNDGFKLRDGDYAGTLKEGQAVVIQVNLYAGNEYWFCVATADPKTTVSINLYDESGKLLKTNPYTDPHRAAAGFSPDASGPYYVRIADAGPAAAYCLIYSYK